MLHILLTSDLLFEAIEGVCPPVFALPFYFYMLRVCVIDFSYYIGILFPLNIIFVGLKTLILNTLDTHCLNSWKKMYQ